MSAIITTNEVIRYSLAERSFPPDKATRMIPIIEQRFFRSCVGNDFYFALQGVKNNWENKAQWTAGSYSIGDMRWWEDDLYESTYNSNTEEPSLVATKWKPATKFSVAEYDNLWKIYLRPIIANEVIRSIVPQETVKFTGKGAVIQTEDNSNTVGADYKSLDMALRALKENINIITEEMIEYIKEQQDKYDSNPATGYDYRTAKVSFLDCGECTTVQSSQKRRFAFKH